MTPPTRPDPRDADGRFRTVASERRFDGSIVSVRVDTVTMPGGGTARREVVDHDSAVAIVALDEQDRVVLIEQYRHPLRRRLWELPAGLMDVPGESPLDCARRELHEETGLAADHWSVLVDLASSPGFCTEAVRVFLATGLSELPAVDASDEEADLRVVRLALDDAVAAVLRGDIVNATAVAGLLAAARNADVRNAGAEIARSDTAVSVPGLRSGDEWWADSLALVNDSAAIGSAPGLAAARVRSAPAAALRPDRS